jgi:hypothetical protein
MLDKRMNPASSCSRDPSVAKKVDDLENSLPSKKVPDLQNLLPTNRIEKPFTEKIKPSIKNIIYDDGVEFTDWRTPIPKGSTVKKLSLLFADANIFYHKFQSYALSLGHRVKETQSIEDDLCSVIITCGSILQSKGISTNHKKVSFQ